MPLDGASAAATPPAFGDPRYWEEVYMRPPEGSPPVDGDDEACLFDWLQGWEGLGWLLEPLLAHDTERTVLHLGCGTSVLAEEFYDRGYRRQTSLDIVPVAIERMAARNRVVRPHMRWVVADATTIGDLLEEGSFDLVVEKSTLDALLCNDRHALVVARLLREASRLLRSNGIFLSVSMYGPRSMLRWLRQPAFGWQVRTVELCSGHEEGAGAEGQAPGPRERVGRRRNTHHAYICSRRRGADECLGDWQKLLEQLEEHPDSDVSDPGEGEEEDEAALALAPTSPGSEGT